MSNEEILIKYALKKEMIQKNIKERPKKYQRYEHLSLYKQNKNKNCSFSLFIAIERNNLDSFVELLQFGCPFDILYDGWTPLSLSAWYGRVEMVKILISMGANIYRKNPNGSALEIAKIKSEECYKILLEAKENYEKEYTLILTTCSYGNLLNYFIFYLREHSKETKINKNWFQRQLAIFLKQYSEEERTVIEEFSKEIWKKSDGKDGEKALDEGVLRNILKEFISNKNNSKIIKSLKK